MFSSYFFAPISQIHWQKSIKKKEQIFCYLSEHSEPNFCLNIGFTTIWYWMKLESLMLIWRALTTLMRQSLASQVKLTTCFHEFSEYESTNFFSQNFLWLAQNWKKCHSLINKEFVLFFNWKIWVQKIRRIIFEKFVKTCDELVISLHCGWTEIFYWGCNYAILFAIFGKTNNIWHCP